ncbi:ankyrin repeat-containing domain protein [Aspergillus californicus]
MAVATIHEIINSHSPSPPLHFAASHDNIEAIKILLEYGANIDVQDAGGRSLLRRAVESNSYLAIQYFLQLWLVRCVSVRPISYSFYSTPLEYALRQGDTKMIDLLSYTSPHDRIAVCLSLFDFCETPATFAHLLRRGYELPSRMHLIRDLILDALSDLDLRNYVVQAHLIPQLAVDKHEVPPLFLQYILPFIPQLLRALGKDRMRIMLPTAPQDHDSPLCIAAWHGLLEPCQTLLSLNADLNFEGHKIGTPLMVACAYGAFEIVKLFVRAGARLAYFNSDSNEYRSALSIAQDHPEICRWLLVDRYIDQAKISYGTSDTPYREISSWSGIKQVGLPFVGSRQRRYDESLLDHVVRLYAVKLQSRGKVVYYSALSEDLS